jgi:hypothetical protein
VLHALHAHRVPEEDGVDEGHADNFLDGREGHFEGVTQEHLHEDRRTEDHDAGGEDRSPEIGQDFLHCRAQRNAGSRPESQY